jgi:hypothetical protein
MLLTPFRKNVFAAFLGACLVCAVQAPAAGSAEELCGFAGSTYAGGKSRSLPVTLIDTSEWWSNKAYTATREDGSGAVTYSSDRPAGDDHQFHNSVNVVRSTAIENRSSQSADFNLWHYVDGDGCGNF